MTKIKVFYGDNEEFQKITPIRSHSLTELALKFDEETKQFSVNVPGQSGAQVKKKKKSIENLVIRAEEYAGVQEHVLMNFSDFLRHYIISCLYIQNPGEQVLRQIRLLYRPELIEIKRQNYNRVSEDIIRKINSEFDQRIYGQSCAKKAIMRAIYLATCDSEHKPIVILFYGNSGVGKTETVQYLGQLLGEKVFRKQFSMFQNNEFATYMFGGKYNEKSFTQDLLGRSSNLILLDEFDKANPVFYSAFYQLFDEGIIEDSHYRAKLDDAIIICTSNFHSEEEARKNLGEPIFDRFDAVIEFDELSYDAKVKIAEHAIGAITSAHPGFVFSDDEIQNLYSSFDSFHNAREIKRIIQEMYSYLEIDRILGENATES